MVDGNPERARLLAPNAGRLELAKAESPALADLGVITDRLRTDGGAEKVKRADTEGGGLGGAGLATAELAPGLVEPGAHAALPVLSEVIAVENVVVGETHF